MRDKIKNIFYLTLIVFILVGCTNSEKKEIGIQKKTDEELNYIEDSIFNIVNKYSKGEYFSDNKINWDNISNDEKKINDTLDNLLIDLSEIDISNEDLVEFSNRLNILLINTSNKNEYGVVTELSNIYSLIPKYMEKYSNNKNEISKKNLKSLILLSYAYSVSENWDEAKKSIQNVENKYSEMMNDIDYMQENSYNLNKVYILTQELKSAINIENINLVNLKYTNLIENI